MGIQWVQQNSGDELPQNALVGGKENADGNNAVLYLGRATREDGSKHPGKVRFLVSLGRRSND
jgi:hypothetical protein